jgi:hypothetical protein
MAKKRTKRYRYKLGDVIAIPLPDERFAYARVYNDPVFGIYDILTDSRADVADVIARDVVFWPGWNVDLCAKVSSGEWPIIGEHPFEDDEAKWPPPQRNFWGDGIYYRGELRPATREETAGMDVVTMYLTPEQLTTAIIEKLEGRGKR